MSDTTKTDLAAGQSSATTGTSTGPKTAEGKARSSLNALKHGRYALKHPTVLSIEDSEAFRDLFRDNLAHFAPASPVEARLVQQLTHVEWSVVRLQAIETAYFNRIYQDQLSPASGQPQAVDSPTRLGIALESSVNTSQFATFIAKRISALNVDRDRHIRALKSFRRFTANPEKFISGESPSGASQTTDSIEE